MCEDEGGNKNPDLLVRVIDMTRTPTDMEGKLLGPRSDSTPGLVEFYIDVAIAEIHSRGKRRDILVKGAANAVEEKKMKHYRAFEKARHVKVLPFGLSSSGELGDSAVGILKMMKEMAAKKEMKDWDEWGATKMAPAHTEGRGMQTKSGASERARASHRERNCQNKFSVNNLVEKFSLTIEACRSLMEKEYDREMA